MSTVTKQLPTGWKRTRLDEACDVILGQSPPGNTYNINGNGLPFFQGKAEFGDYYPTPVKWCSVPTKIAEPEDVLISVRAPVGPTNLCPSKACIGRGLAAIRSKYGMPPRYVLYAIRATVTTLAEKATGSTFEAVNGTDLRAHEIPVAPYPEQRRIVAEIEKQFTRLEVGVAALKRVQANLKRYRATVLKAACEGKLVPTEAELAKKEKRTYETGDELLERISKERHKSWTGHRKCEVPVMIKTSYLPNLPEGWTWTSFDQVCEALSDQRKKVAKTNYLIEGQFPIIDQGEIFVGGYSNDETLLFSGKIPVILFGDHTRRFKLAEERFIVGADGIKLIGLTASWDARFLWYQFQQLKFEDRGYSRHFQFVRKAPLRLPPLVEQRRIVAEVERHLSVIEELEAVVTANLQRATRLRQSILQKAFSGNLC